MSGLHHPMLSAISLLSVFWLCNALGEELEFSVAGLEAAAKHNTQSFAKREFQQCHIDDNSDDIRCLQLTPLPQTYTSAADLPANWDWRDIKGINYVVPSLNQHIPKYCGACWIFATVHALSDRIKIARNALTPEITLAPQALLNCGTRMKTSSWEHMNCHGGTAAKAYRYISEYGLPDNTCQPYVAEAHTCDDFSQCYTCVHNTTCFPIKKYTVYKLKEYGQVSGETNMMAEIYRRGPITCKTAVSDDLMDYSGGIFHDKTGEMQIRHAVEVVGWGTTKDGVKYWIVRNSWGTYWGENGFYRIVRGINNLNLENNCMWGVPEWDEKTLETGFTVEEEFSVKKAIETREEQVQQADLALSAQDSLALVQDITTLASGEEDLVDLIRQSHVQTAH